jgi:hypothetical protein
MIMTSFLSAPRPLVPGLLAVGVSGLLCGACIEVRQSSVESDTTAEPDTGTSDGSDPDTTKPPEDIIAPVDTVSDDTDPTDTVDPVLPPVETWDIRLIEPSFLTFFHNTAPPDTIRVRVTVPSQTEGETPVAGATLRLSWLADEALQPGAQWNVGPTCTTDASGICDVTPTAPLTGPDVWRFRIHPLDNDPHDEPYADILAEALAVVNIATGPRHSCAILNDGSLRCWGWNGPSGEPDDDDTVTGRPMTEDVGPGVRAWPTRVPTPGHVERVTMTGSFSGYETEGAHATTCIATSGRDDAGTWCIGSPYKGQIGDGVDNSPIPDWWSPVIRAGATTGEEDESMEPAVYLAGHHDFMCAVVDDGDATGGDDEAYCWGSNESRQLGQMVDEDVEYASRGVVIGISLLNENGTGTPALSVGRAHACVVRYESDSGVEEGVAPRAYCWGSNEHGQLGFSIERSPVQPLPTQFPSTWTLPCKAGGTFTASDTDVTSKLRVQQVATGGDHTCAIVRLQGLSAALSSTLKTDCLVDDAKTLVWCAGANDRGQGGPTGLAEGRWLTDASGVPVSGFRELVAGAEFTCGTNGSAVFCWGDNSLGQIGAGQNQTHSHTPVKMELPEPSANGPLVIRKLVAGPAHACAIVGPSMAASPLDELYCWGDNSFGQSGKGRTTANLHMARLVVFQ